MLAVTVQSIISYSLHQWEEIFGCPPFGIPIVEVTTLRTRVHHKIDRTAASKTPTRWNYCLATIDGFFRICLVEECCFGFWQKMHQIHGWVGDGRVIVIVGTAFYEENGQAGICSCKTAGCNTSCGSTTVKAVSEFVPLYQHPAPMLTQQK